MPFDLKGGARRVALTAGDRVKLRLAVKGGRSWVDRLDVISAAPVDAGLEQTPVTHVLVPVGSPLPDFELTDQTGAPLALSALKGKVVAVTFIYSRCPLPDYCPRMVENFRAIRARFADRMDSRSGSADDQLRSAIRHAPGAGAVCRVDARGRSGLAFPDRRSGERSNASATRSGFSIFRMRG